MRERTAPVLILAPSGRDAAVAATILGEVGVVTTVCLDLDALVSGLDRAGGAVVTEEALRHSDRPAAALVGLSLRAAHIPQRGCRRGPDCPAGECDRAGASVPSLRSRQCGA